MSDVESFPQVSTRGHFNCVGALKSDKSPTGYDFKGRSSFPGIGSQAAQDPDELLIYVHGIGNDELMAVENFETARDNFHEAGFDHPVVGYTWDSNYLWGAGWYEAKRVATANGRKLAQFIEDYRSNHDATIRLVVHSLGTRVACSALQGLEADSRTDAVKSLTIFGGAIGDKEMGTEDAPFWQFQDRFGQTVQEFDDLRVDSYRSEDDQVLSKLFYTAEFGTKALGQAGAKGPTPDNYHEFNKSGSVTDHSQYVRDQKIVKEAYDSFPA